MISSIAQPVGQERTISVDDIRKRASDLGTSKGVTVQMVWSSEGGVSPLRCASQAAVR